MMLYRMDRDYDIQDAFGTPQSLGAFKVVLDATFHEFFGAPSAPFIGGTEGMKKIHRNMLRLCQSSIVKQEKGFYTNFIS